MDDICLWNIDVSQLDEIEVHTVSYQPLFSRPFNPIHLRPHFYSKGDTLVTYCYWLIAFLNIKIRSNCSVVGSLKCIRKRTTNYFFFSSEVIICGMQLFVQSGVTIELLDMGSILLYACNLSLPNDNPSFPWANR